MVSWPLSSVVCAYLAPEVQIRMRRRSILSPLAGFFQPLQLTAGARLCSALASVATSLTRVSEYCGLVWLELVAHGEVIWLTGLYNTTPPRVELCTLCAGILLVAMLVIRTNVGA